MYDEFLALSIFLLMLCLILNKQDTIIGAAAKWQLYLQGVNNE